ncbi:MAG: DUF222 domain-containing protein [Streptosporangiales bacterium]|nr:DUF222 domain-containing protein [Streptosporangiales bacterium]
MSSNTRVLLAQLAEIAAELAGGAGPDSPTLAMEETHELARAVDLLQAAVVARVGRVDAEKAAQAWGYPSTSAWLRQTCRIRRGQAAERVTVARQLRRLPATEKLFAAGELGYAHTAAVRHAVKHYNREVAEQAEDILLDLAREGSVEDVAKAGGHLRRVLDPDGSNKDDERGFDRRWLSIADLLDGKSHFEGIFDPEMTACLKSALDPLAKPAGTDDPRTREQRYADALYTLIRGRQQSHMSVVVDLDTLTGGDTPGILPGGHAISAADARRIAENAGLSRVIVGPGSVPLDVGREQRLVTPAIRRALEVRDRTCVVNGCDIPAALCEADHVTPWTLGGETSLANTVLACGFHHKWKTRHPDQVQITHHPDGRITYRIPRPGHWPP